MQHLTYMMLGLGNGSVYAAIAIGIVLVYRTSGVVHLAAGATAMYSAYTYALLSTRGMFFNPLAATPQVTAVVCLATLYFAVVKPARQQRRLTRRSAVFTAIVVLLALGMSQDALIDVGKQRPVLALVVAVVTAMAFGAAAYWVIFRRLQNAMPLGKIAASVGLMLALQSLCSQHFGDQTVVGAALFPSKAVQIGSIRIGEDRLYLAAVVLLTAIGLTVVYRCTKFGLRSLAVAETDVGAMLVGLSPTKVGVYSWMLSGAVAGVFGALLSPLAAVTAYSYTLFVIPALGAALVARFSSVLTATLAGLLLGMFESELLNLQTRTWWPKAFTPSLLPFVAIVVVMVFRGRSLPARGSLLRQAIPPAPEPRRVLFWTVAGSAAAIIGLLTMGDIYRVAITMSLIGAILSLSLVVVTGFVGQISLAQMAFAGVGGFVLAPVTNHFGVPFPLAPVVAALIAGAAGFILGLPALRVRGMDLAVLTLAMAVAVEQSYFSNTAVNGGVGGSVVDTPRLFGIDLGIGAGGVYPRPHMGFVALGFLVLVALGVVGLRRSRLGLQMLAVRANERAAASTGIHVSRTKLVAFGISAFLAGLAGALTGYVQAGGLSAASFGVFLNFGLVSIAVLVGISSISGGITAGFASGAGLLGVFLHDKAHIGSWYEFVLAVGLIAAAIRHPEGLLGQVQEHLSERRHRRRAEPEPGDRTVVAEPSAPAVVEVVGSAS